MRNCYVCLTLASHFMLLCVFVLRCSDWKYVYIYHQKITIKIRQNTNLTWWSCQFSWKTFQIQHNCAENCTDIIKCVCNALSIIVILFPFYHWNNSVLYKLFVDIVIPRDITLRIFVGQTQEAEIILFIIC